MKPAPFDILRPTSLSEAGQILVETNGAAKPVAGAQSLGPMLNLRLAQPPILIDITGIAELTRVEDEKDALTLGACVTTGSIEDLRVPTHGLAMLPRVASGIAYRAVRNRGTIGGSVCHADPAADWLSSLMALGAECLITGPQGQRRVLLRDFMISPFEVDLGEGELLDAVRIERVSPMARWGYYKICRKVGKFATAIGVVMNDPERGIFRAVLGATNGRPIVVDDARHLFSTTLSLNEDAVGSLLENHGIVELAARKHHMTALQRAAAQVTAP